MKTESITGGDGKVGFHLYPTQGEYITTVWWLFNDWGYVIAWCSPNEYQLKFPVKPPSGVSKTWEITAAPEGLTIKCNNVEVLYYIYNNTYKDFCISRTKGKIATQIEFYAGDTATTLFSTVAPVIFGK